MKDDQQGYEIYIKHRLEKGINGTIPLIKGELKETLEGDPTPEKVELIAEISTQTNAVLIGNRLSFLHPLYIDDQWLEGTPTGTHLLEPGRILIGGPLVVGSEGGDLLFDDYSALLTTLLVGEQRLIILTVTSISQ